MAVWLNDPEMVKEVSAAVVHLLRQPNSKTVGLYASVAWFEPEPSAVTWRSRRQAV
ncbi:hypothetical protein ACWDYH_39750 [Nocardia goodfellowii]